MKSNILAPVFVLGFFALVALPACRSDQTGGDSFEVAYLSATLNVEIHGNSIRVTRIQQTFDQPASSVPSSLSSKTMKGTLTEAQVTKLKSLIRTNGFMDLNPYYGAPERQRFYPYTVHVKSGGQDKIVTFRSNPSYPGSPEAFRQVEQMINDLTAAADTPEPAEKK